MKEDKSLKNLIKTNPKLQFALAVFTFIYVVSPIDIVPDITPILGYLDDAAVFLTELISLLMYIKNKKESINNGTTDKQENKY